MKSEKFATAMEKMTIEFAGHKVSMRVYDYERDVMHQTAVRLGARVAG